MDAFVGLGGRVLFAPTSPSSRDSFVVHVRDEDVVVPVCDDGVGRSQCLYLALHGLKRGCGIHRVVVPHGVERGFDPFTAYGAGLTEEDACGYLMDAMLPRGAPGEWIAENFFSVFGVDKSRRLGEVTCALNNFDLNPDFGDMSPEALARLSTQRTAQVWG